LATVVKNIGLSYKIDYRFFKPGTFLQRSKLPWSLTKPQLLYVFILPSKTCQHHVEARAANV